MLTKVYTPTGPWFTMDRVVGKEDFSIVVDGPVFNNRKQSYARYTGSIVITPRQSLIDELVSVSSDVDQLFALLKHTPVIYHNFKPISATTYQELTKGLSYVRSASVPVRLKNVTKESTRKARMEQARVEAMDTFKKGSPVIAGIVDEFIRLFNDGVARTVADNNNSVRGRMSQALKSDKIWSDHADKHGSHGDLLAEIESIEKDIEELERRLSDRQNELKDKRTASWRGLWESDGWSWSEKGVVRVLPDEYRDAMIERLDSGEAFSQTARHRRYRIE